MKYADVKMYKVKFLNYTNGMENAVSDDSRNMDYIDIPKETKPYIILKESQLEKYKRYGNGYASVEYIGSTIDDEAEDDEELEDDE